MAKIHPRHLCLTILREKFNLENTKKKCYRSLYALVSFLCNSNPNHNFTATHSYNLINKTILTYRLIPLVLLQYIMLSTLSILMVSVLEWHFGYATLPGFRLTMLLTFSLRRKEMWRKCCHLTSNNSTTMKRANKQHYSTVRQHY